MKKTDIYLISPPLWLPFSPPIGIPAVYTYLKEKGFKVLQEDMNLDFFYKMLRQDKLEIFFNSIKERANDLRRKGDISKQEIKDYRMALEVISGAEFAIENIENALIKLKDFTTYSDIDQIRLHLATVSKSMQLILYSGSYYTAHGSMFPAKNAYLDNTRYKLASTPELLKAIKDPDNPFAAYFKEYCIKRIKHSGVKLIGISVTSWNQLLPGFTLASLIKENIKDVHITIGGWHFTNIIPDLIKNRALFDIADSFVVREGEPAIDKLADAVLNSKSLEAIPNLIYRSGELIIENDEAQVASVSDLPTFDYTGFDLTKYLVPETCITLPIARGCFWKRCRYCVSHKVRSDYNRRSPDKLIEDIKIYKDRYSINNFTFGNESMEPGHLRRIADSIISSRLDISWYCGMRFEDKLDEDFIKTLASAGCKRIYFGAESMSPRVLELMQKGIKTEKASDILELCSRYGIAVYLFLIVGFPGETYATLKETYDFLIEHESHINHFGSDFTVYCFLLKKNTDMEKNPEKYGIQICDYPYYELSPSRNFRVLGKGLITRQEAQKERLNLIYKLRQKFDKCLNLPIEILMILLNSEKYSFAYNDKRIEKDTLKSISFSAGRTISLHNHVDFIPFDYPNKIVNNQDSLAHIELVKGQYILFNNMTLEYLLVTEDSPEFYLINKLKASQIPVKSLLEVYNSRYGETKTLLLHLEYLKKNSYIDIK